MTDVEPKFAPAYVVCFRCNKIQEPNACWANVSQKPVIYECIKACTPVPETQPKPPPETQPQIQPKVTLFHRILQFFSSNPVEIPNRVVEGNIEMSELDIEDWIEEKPFLDRKKENKPPGLRKRQAWV